MKKSSFDPFMINNFSGLVKHGKPVTISTSDMGENDLMGMTFVEKSSNVRIPKVRAGLVVLITSNSIGENNSLGNDLLKNFCISLSSGLELPEYIFLLNTGLKVLLDDNIVESLKKIQKYGTNVISSLESVEYFDMNNYKMIKKWAIGDMTSVLMNANKVIKI